MNPAALVTLLATLTTLGTASAAWQRISTTGDRPADLACDSMPSTSVFSSEGIGKSGALLSDGATDVATLPAGRSEAVIQLSGQHLIDVVTFVNSGAEGKVTLSGSPNGKDWTPLGQNVFSPGERFVATTFAGAQAKFVQAVFELSSSGYISSFKIAGGLSTEDFSIGDATSNLVGGVGGARMIYAHPSPSNVGEKDFELNVVQFSKTQEKYRTVIYDLGAVRKVTSFSASYSARPVRIQAYAFDQLPEQKDWRGKLTLDPAIFDQASPVATGEDTRGVGMLKILPSKPVVAQYIAIRFEPNYQVASNGNPWSEFAAFAMAPYHQAGSVFTSTSGSKLVAADNGPPFTLFDLSFISSSGSGNGTFYAQYGSTPDETPGGGSTDNAPTYWPGGPGWFVGSPFGYLNRSLGGTGNFSTQLSPNLANIIANSRRGNVFLTVNPRVFVPIIQYLPPTSQP